MYLPDHYVVGKYCRHCVAAGRNSATVGGGGETLSPSTMWKELPPTVEGEAGPPMGRLYLR